MKPTIAVTPDQVTECQTALGVYATSLRAGLEAAGVGADWAPGELWEEVSIVEPEWAEDWGYPPVHALVCEIGDLALYGESFEWRDQPYPVAVPEGFRAIAPTSYAVQLLPERLAATLEGDRGAYRELFLDRATRKVRKLNDLLRTTLFGGRVVLTEGVQTSPVRDEIVRAVMDQDPRERPGDDPFGKHEFGAVVVGGVQYYWKVDCYDKSYAVMSPDPSDPFVTNRVLTILRADEW